VLVDDNNRVHKGDLLVQLDKEPYQDAVAVKRAAVDVAWAIAGRRSLGRVSIPAKLFIWAILGWSASLCLNLNRQNRWQGTDKRLHLARRPMCSFMVASSEAGAGKRLPRVCGRSVFVRKVQSGARPNVGFRIDVDGRPMTIWELWARFRSEIGDRELPSKASSRKTRLR
jgi:hypothetical protein